METVVLVAKLKLKNVTELDAVELDNAITAYTNALNYVSKYVAENKLYGKSYAKIQKEVYYDIKSKFNLSSQFACAVCKVVAAKYKSLISNKWLYKTKKGKQTGEINVPQFKPKELDYVRDRNYSLNKNGIVSISTLNGRRKFGFYNTGYNYLFEGDWDYGQAKLKKINDSYYLYVTFSKQIETFTPNTVGVDLGLNFLATAYNGTSTTFYSGKKVKEYRAHYKKLRRELQSKGTKSAKRRLAAINQRENRFMNDVNHCVTKALVLNNPNSLFIVEDLKSVRNSLVKVKKNDRYYMVSWSYRDFIEKLSYKALLHNSLVVEVNPKYTSQTCPICGHKDKDNRNKKLHTFKCRNCGYTSNDDRIGAMNLYNKRSEIT